MEKSERSSEKLPADIASDLIRQTLSMPLLGTCMYPEIGLAGSGTGTGVFRKEFMKERRRASQGAPKKGHKRTESCDVGVRPLERLEGVLAEGLPSPQSLSSRCDSGWTARDSCSSVSDSPWGSEVQGERRRRFTVNSSSTTSVEELPSACARTAARGKGRFLIADGVPLTGPVDKRLGSLVSRGRISGPNRKFAVHSPSVPRTFVAAEASALPTDSASASASALPPWSRSASAGDVSRMRWRGASPMEGAHPPASLPEEGVWHEGLSRESSMARLLAEAEGGTALLEAMALPRDAPGAPPAPQPLHMLAGLLEAQRDLLLTEHAALKHLNAKLHELLKERRRDAARASAERQRAAGTGVGLAESRDKDREHPQP